MSEDVYQRLADAINARGAAYPAVPCPEFYAVAREFFTPEEAEIACHMPNRSAVLEELAGHISKIDQSRLQEHLENMAEKGVVRVKEVNGKKYYELLPFVPGSIELQFMRGRDDERTKRLAQLLREYAKALRNMATAAPQAAESAATATRTILVRREVQHLSTILPCEEVFKLIENTKHIAAGTCVCRHQGDLLDRPCDKPKANMCMVFGESARFVAEYGFARPISKEEARRSIEEAEKAGLVHSYANTEDRAINLLCNCCGCHCFILRPLSRHPSPAQGVIAEWVSVIDEDDCTGCGACVDRCWMKALGLEGDRVVCLMERCIGCGVCRYVCPTDAIKLERRVEVIKS